MKTVLTGRQMKACDEKTIHTLGVPSLVLMERAALACAKELEKLLPKEEQGSKPKILVLCGNGNNGGDGIAIARILKERGMEPVLWMTGISEEQRQKGPEEALQKLSPDCARQLQIARAYGVREIGQKEGMDMLEQKQADLVVDAMFGVGLSRTLLEPYSTVIGLVNRSGAKILAVDIPSGIHADTGECMGTAVQADVTVTFAFYKRGQLLYPGRAFCGKCLVKDIGITPVSLSKEDPLCFCYEEEDLFRLPERSPSSNKGTYGKVLMIAGSSQICGAAYFAGMAACRTGAGLVQVMTHTANRQVLNQKLPEALFSFYGEEPLEKARIREKLSWATVIGIGPGLGTGEDGRLLLETVLEDHNNLPLVIDADGLNLLGETGLLEKLSGRSAEGKEQTKDSLQERPLIVTPHMGEMSRLTGIPIKKLKADPVGCGTDFAKRYGCVCVLKDACTAVCSPDGKVFLNTSGNNGMSTGGSGDVLTGVICGLLAQHMPAFEAAALGVYLHGLAGDRGAEKQGCYSLLARDILREIGELINEQRL